MRTAELGQWLIDAGLPAETRVTGDGLIPEMPDRIVHLTRTPGGQTLRERSFDSVVVQVIARSGQGELAGDQAQTLADAVDNLLLATVPPLTIGASRVISLDRQGGPPAFLDRDPSERVLYVCSYVFQVARSVI